MHGYMIAEIISELIKTGAIRDEKEMRMRTEKALKNYGKDKLFEVWTVEDIIDWLMIDNTQTLRRQRQEKFLKRLIITLMQMSVLTGM